MTLAEAKPLLVAAVLELTAEKREMLEQLKKGSEGLERPDFIWHYLLQSFATMGRAAAWKGLIGNAANYNRVTYEAIANVAPGERRRHIEAVCREAGVRMPNRKADFILGCFDRIQEMGGPTAAKSRCFPVVAGRPSLRFSTSFGESAQNMRATS